MTGSSASRRTDKRTSRACPRWRDQQMQPAAVADLERIWPWFDGFDFGVGEHVGLFVDLPVTLPAEGIFTRRSYSKDQQKTNKFIRLKA
jgi:hypothetical protein